MVIESQNGPSSVQSPGSTYDRSVCVVRKQENTSVLLMGTPSTSTSIGCPLNNELATFTLYAFVIPTSIWWLCTLSRERNILCFHQPSTSRYPQTSTPALWHMTDISCTSPITLATLCISLTSRLLSFDAFSAKMMGSTDQLQYVWTGEGESGSAIARAKFQYLISGIPMFTSIVQSK